MKLIVVGTGYVGLVTGTCLADAGNYVTCVDTDTEKVESLRQGRVPFYEPELPDLILRNVAANRLRFTAHLPTDFHDIDVVFIAVGTPPRKNGEADLSAVESVAASLAAADPPPRLVVIKSTVPVGTGSRLQLLFNKRTGGATSVANNPEFLREGAAVADFNYPDRIVVGATDEESSETLKKLYAPLVRTLHPILVMSRESAEMTKYAANCLLASRISFMNEIANLCHATGASVTEVRGGMGFDSRIGFRYLFAGVGYGGSCFPKDVQALAAVGRQVGVPVDMLESIHAVNERQKRNLAERLIEYFDGSIAGRTIGVWGLAFKPKTDDVREAPAMTIIRMLLAAGAKVQVYDPVAMESARRELGDRVSYARTNLEALDGADALVVVTEWQEFRTLDFGQMRRRMRGRAVFDGRNLYHGDELASEGFDYFSMGHADVHTSVDESGAGLAGLREQS